MKQGGRTHCRNLPFAYLIGVRLVELNGLVRIEAVICWESAKCEAVNPQIA